MIGQSPYFRESSEMFCKFFPKQVNCESLQLNNNMLRGAPGFEMIQTIRSQMTLQRLGLNSNFLGQRIEQRRRGKDIPPAELKEAPVNLISEMFIYSKFLEKIDLGYNHITS